MHIAKHTVAFVVALAAAGCAAHWNPKLKAKLVKRARFDLSCEDVSLTALDKDRNGIINTYGVTGCGQRATYVLTSSDTWVLNVVDGRTGSAPDDSPPPPPSE